MCIRPFATVRPRRVKWRRLRVRAGLTALGFSGHSFVEFDPSCGMNAETAGRYRVEIHALRKEYAEALPIFSGIEKDVYGEADTAPYDYVIGSGHYVPLPGGGFSPVDVSPETTNFCNSGALFRRRLPLCRRLL